MKLLYVSTLLLATSLNISQSLSADRPESGHNPHNPRQFSQQQDEFDFRSLISDPTLIVNLSVDIRQEAITRINDFKTINTDLNAIKKGEIEYKSMLSKLTTEDKMRQLVAAKESFSFYLDLKLKEEERITTLTQQKLKIDEGRTNILLLLDKRQEKAQNHHLKLDAKIRKEERSFFGWIKDNVIWGRIINAVPQNAGYQQIKANVEQATLEILEHLNNRIENAQSQHETLTFLWTRAHEKVEALES